MKRRIRSMLLVLCMVFTMMPVGAFATDTGMPIGTGNVIESGSPAVCKHEHNEECGYVEAKQGIPAIEEIPCDNGCADTDENGVINHAEGCAYTPAVDASPAVDGADCTHACELCTDDQPMAMMAPRSSSTEQFNLPVGDTYYFDLSGEAGTIKYGESSTMGTINVGYTGDVPYPGLPDATLHYVPFTYVGTINAYSLTSESSGDTGASSVAGQSPSDRSLFLADYNVSHSKSWMHLNDANLIFGKEYDIVDAKPNYILRSLSGGNSITTENIVMPETNE